MDGKAGKVLRITMKYLSQNMNIKYLVVDSIGHHVRTAAKKRTKTCGTQGRGQFEQIVKSYLAINSLMQYDTFQFDTVAVFETVGGQITLFSNSKTASYNAFLNT